MSLNSDQLESYHRDGYVIVRRLFDAEEMALLGRAAREDRQLDEQSFGREDGEGGNVRLAVWNQPGEGIYGMFARCQRTVDAVEQILEDEVYHYHSKMIMKDPQIGGAWAWHQDYGYWYHNSVLWPDLCSVSIAVDAATKENGCMQALKGSHKLGRVDHVQTGQQAGADVKRVEEAVKRHELDYCQMEPGDAMFFHCNLLHRSDQNHSPKPRWSMICCYNARHNDPYADSHHPRYSLLEKVSDSAIKEVGIKRFGDDQSDVSWIDSSRPAAEQFNEPTGDA